jgi:protein TonB
MSSPLAASHPLEESSSQLESAPAVDTDHVAARAALLSHWPAPLPRPSFSSRELCGVLALTALLHAGVATAAYGSDKTPPAKRISRVEIELARPPERPKPLTPPLVPPPPPKVVQQQAKPLAVAQPVIEPSVAPPPVDTGSSAPAEEGGELYAGNGGLGAAPPAPPAPVVPVAAPVAAPTIQPREGANYLKNPRPAYPRRAKREGWQGTTLLRILVQASGKPGSVKINQSSGHELLDEAAVDAVSKWSFVPATQGGTPVAGFVTVPIVFRLQQQLTEDQ